MERKVSGNDLTVRRNVFPTSAAHAGGIFTDADSETVVLFNFYVEQELTKTAKYTLTCARVFMCVSQIFICLHESFPIPINKGIANKMAQ